MVTEDEEQMWCNLKKLGFLFQVLSWNKTSLFFFQEINFFVLHGPFELQNKYFLTIWTNVQQEFL